VLPFSKVKFLFLKQNNGIKGVPKDEKMCMFRNTARQPLMLLQVITHEKN